MDVLEGTARKRSPATSFPDPCAVRAAQRSVRPLADTRWQPGMPRTTAGARIDLWTWLSSWHPRELCRAWLYGGVMGAAVRRRVADAWVVAGPPGAGKNTVAEQMLRVLAPTPALLDKDTLFGRFVAAALAAANRPDGEREGAWYDSHVKVHEYASLAITARQIRERGCPVLLVAPFTEQIHDAARWSAFVQEIGGGVVRLVWVQSNAATLRARIVERGSTRDAQKLARFDEFVERMRPDEAPELPGCFVVNNRIDAPESIEEQVRQLLATGP